LQLDPDTRTLVYRWAYRVLQNHHDALDATQEVLLRVYSRTTEGIDDASAWLRRVTVNYCLDMIRRRRPSVEAPEVADSRPPGAAADARELHDAVVTALADLSDQQRAVIVAKVYDQQTFADIAAGLGISASSAKTHYFRALRAMRSSLASFGDVLP
jgi:RNA polymerase sigma-70 factor (ECF subfamily)